MAKIEIVLCYDQRLDKKMVEMIAYGIEEEGIPFELKETSETDAHKNAVTAAFQSKLDVGIGMSCDGVAIRNNRFEKDMYLFDKQLCHIKDFKAYGANAARLIKGVPFKVF